MKNNIILIGFMGCGKTSTGIRLSYALRRTLIDTDKWIEKKQKMSISELFASKGEACFREMETDCIRELIRTEDNRRRSTPRAESSTRTSASGRECQTACRTWQYLLFQDHTGDRV